MNDNDRHEVKRAVSGAFVVVVCLILAFVLIGVAGLYFNRFAKPFAEKTRAQTYDKSRAYNQGTNRDIARYCRDYAESPEGAKRAVADLIRTTADTYQGELSPANQACLSEIAR